MGRDAAVRAVLALEPDRAAVVQRLKKGVPVPLGLAPGWHLIAVLAEDGQTRPCQIYIPKTLPAEPVPLLVHMHGGVGRADFGRTKGRVGYGGMLWPKVAEEHKLVVVFPEARADCAWWTDPGVGHLRACIREAKRLANIDDDAIVGTGFSDGGSGCYYLAMAAPDPFAAFLPMNGHPAVAASASKKQLYLHNLKLAPLFVAMTSDDQLYPAKSVLPHLLPALALGANMHLVNYPTGGHRPVYFKEQLGAFVRFIADTPRDAAPTELEWRCAARRTARCRWVEIEKIGASEGDATAPPDLNVMSTPGRIRLGVRVDVNHVQGVRFEAVVAGSVAASMGMKDGDILLELDGKPVPDLGALRSLLGKKAYGDLVTARVRRGETELPLEGRFPAFRSKPYYSRAKPTAWISVSVEGQTIQVTSRNVRRFKLHLSPDLFGDQPVVVRVNGRAQPAKTMAVDLERILTRYAHDADAGRVFTREVTVEVRP